MILKAINFITTVLNMRAPGMTLHKVPLTKTQLKKKQQKKNKEKRREKKII